MADVPESTPLVEKEDAKIYDLEDVQKHTKEEDCWLVVDGEVFNVTNFLDEHPGGFDIIIANTGKDATEDFNEIGHSKSARELLQNYKIGKYKGGKPPPKPSRRTAVRQQQTSSQSLTITLLKAFLPLFLIAAILIPKLFSSEKK